jgi:hypothetical protein
MYESKVLLLIFIFLAVWFSFIYVTKLIRRERIPCGNFLILAIGIVGTIAYFL